MGMARVLLSGCLVALLAASAAADKLILTDGRTFTGTVAVEGDTVLITVPYGTLRFPKTQVERIELMDTPEQEFRKKLGEAPLDDPNALYNLAQWADHSSLARQAGDLYALILKLSPNHRATRKALGYIRVGKSWLTFDQALQQARGRLEAGGYEALLEEVLPALKAAATTKARHAEVEELLGLTQLRSRQFAAAAATFAALGKTADPPLAARAAAIADILAENADGMYVLRETYPPSAPLLSGATSAPSVQPGPASIANPLVLEAALRDLAKKQIATGRKLMDEAQKLERTDPDPAASKYAQAEEALNRADALVGGIARSYRIEIARRKIAAIRKDADADAKRFDEAMAKLGLKDMTAPAYKTMVQRLIHHLDSTRDDLKRIQEIAEPFSRELVLEMKWAELDLTKIENMRKILVTELDGRK
jgi:hypothetical protein